MFRQINEELPEGWIAGAHWYVEYHDDQTWVAPKGILFVFAAPNHAVAEYVYVVDSERRKGIATALLNAAQERWPELGWPEADTEEGNRFLRSLGIHPGKPSPETARD
jgi:GNAT superfamily N-acetyltransferase